MNFIKDCLSNKMSLRDIQNKYGIDDIWAKYHEERAKYTEEQINNIMEAVYYVNA